MKTEVIEYTRTDEDGNVTYHTCTVTYKRSSVWNVISHMLEEWIGRANSEGDSVGERQEYHSGIERD